MFGAFLSCLFLHCLLQCWSSHDLFQSSRDAPVGGAFLGQSYPTIACLCFCSRTSRSTDYSQNNASLSKLEKVIKDNFDGIDEDATIEDLLVSISCLPTERTPVSSIHQMRAVLRKHLLCPDTHVPNLSQWLEVVLRFQQRHGLHRWLGWTRRKTFSSFRQHPLVSAALILLRGKPGQPTRLSQWLARIEGAEVSDGVMESFRALTVGQQALLCAGAPPLLLLLHLFPSQTQDAGKRHAARSRGVK
jgi:hypothetical protein